jgi:hypothetical protein
MGRWARGTKGWKSHKNGGRVSCVHAKQEGRRQNEEGKLVRGESGGGPPHSRMLAQITRPPESCQGGCGRRDTAVSRTRTRTRTIGVVCKGSAKTSAQQMKNRMRLYESVSWGAGCGWNQIRCRKYLIFRELGGFFTIFHPFFTPYFRWNRFIVKYLCKIHGYKRRKQFKYKVENVKWEEKRDTNCTNEHEWFLAKNAKGLLNWYQTGALGFGACGCGKGLRLRLRLGLGLRVRFGLCREGVIC